MPYRRTKKYSAQRLEAMRRGKDRARMERPAPDYPPDRADVCLILTVQRVEFGEPPRVFELRKSRRCDSYNVFVDGEFWRKAGITRVLEGVRKACPRVLSQRAIT